MNEKEFKLHSRRKEVIDFGSPNAVFEADPHDFFKVGDLIKVKDDDDIENTFVGVIIQCHPDTLVHWSDDGMVEDIFYYSLDDIEGISESR